jgi:hypothetical protein
MNIGGFSGAPTGFVFGDNAYDLKTFYNGIFADPPSGQSEASPVVGWRWTAEGERMYNGIKAFHDAMTKAGIHQL